MNASVRHSGCRPRISCPRIQDNTPAIPMMMTDAQRAASIPRMKASETPPTRLVVPIKTWKATSLGIEAAETVMAITKTSQYPDILHGPERYPISRHMIPAGRLP